MEEKPTTESGGEAGESSRKAGLGLPSDPRSAPTEPSLRRRASLTESLSSRDAPTPVEPHSLRYRASRRRLGVVSVLLGTAVVTALLLFASANSQKAGGGAPVLSKPSVEAARTAKNSAPDTVEHEDELAVQVVEPTAYPSSSEDEKREPSAGVQERSGRVGAQPPKHASKLSPLVAQVKSGLTASPRPKVPPRASASAPEIWFPPE